MSTIGHPPNYLSRDAARKAGTSERKLRSWCEAGVLGPRQRTVQRGMPRRFTAEEIQVIATLERVSRAHADFAGTNRGVGSMALYVKIANDIRSALDNGDKVVECWMGHGVSLHIDMDS